MQVSAVAQGSYLTRRRARRLSEEARAALDRPPVIDDGGTPPRTHVVGVDPLRILLFGSGPLTGYGVTTRDDAVDGHLARILADRLGRGVTVESRVRLALPVAKAVPSLGGAGTVTFTVAVWAPRFGEELDRASRSRAAVRAMLHEFRDASEIPLVLCHLPTPLGADWRTLLRRPRIAELNRVLDQEAAAVDRVVGAASGVYRPSDASSTKGPAWHAALAEHLAPAVLHMIPSAQPLR